MVLWKKEPNCDADAPFVDLFADKTQITGLKEWNRKLESAEWKNSIFLRTFDTGKNNRTSDFFREMGNKLFSSGDWINAMEFYSQSLCFAEVGTNNVSFALANRATCFLKLKRYDQCLRDIESAEQANYPHMPKLMQRKAVCQQSMKATIRANKSELKLSFNQNVKFPCLADVLEIQMNEEFGRHVIATRDIDVGQTILVEQFFISLGCAPDRVQCYSCTKEEANFIACLKCTDVMFCSEECRSQNKVHQKFCGSNINRMPYDVRYVAESLLLGMLEFSSANEMMSFVDEILAKRATHIPDAINDARSKYGLFLSLKPTKQDIDFDQVYKVFTGLLDIPLIKTMFNSKHSQRFLLHLVAEHWSIIKNNSFNTAVTGGIVSQKLGVVMSLFNHACAPNLFNRPIGDTELFITTRPIKKGEQLFVSYLNHSATTVVRRISLLRFDFVCKCDKCEPHCQSTDRTKMKSDQNFKFLASVPKQQHDLIGVKVKCVEFLRKFGHLPWSEEMDLVLDTYTDYLFDMVSKSF